MKKLLVMLFVFSLNFLTGCSNMDGMHTVGALLLTPQTRLKSCLDSANAKIKEVEKEMNDNNMCFKERETIDKSFADLNQLANVMCKEKVNSLAITNEFKAKYNGKFQEIIGQLYAQAAKNQSECDQWKAEAQQEKAQQDERNRQISMALIGMAYEYNQSPEGQRMEKIRNQCKFRCSGLPGEHGYSGKYEMCVTKCVNAYR